MIPISIVIPTWERYEMLLESFEQVIHDERIGSITIVDDCSSEENYHDVRNAVKWISKVKLYRNESNIQCYHNKREAVSKSENEFCILLDSDNILTKDYIDKIYQHEWNRDMIFTPSFAAPHFDFRAFEGCVIHKHNVAEYINEPMFEVMLNACNYFVNRDAYLEVWDGSTNPVTSDSIFQAYNWLNAGKDIWVVPALTYQHRVHEGSHYQNNVAKTPHGFHKSILDKIMKLK